MLGNVDVSLDKLLDGLFGGLLDELTPDGGKAGSYGFSLPGIIASLSMYPLLPTRAILAIIQHTDRALFEGGGHDLYII